MILPHDVLYHILEECDPKTYFNFLMVCPHLKVKTQYHRKEIERKLDILNNYDNFMCRYYDYAFRFGAPSPKFSMKLCELEYIDLKIDKAIHDASFKIYQQNLLKMVLLGLTFINNSFIK